MTLLTFNEPEGVLTSSDFWTLEPIDANCSFKIVGGCLQFVVSTTANGQYPYVQPGITLSGDFDVILNVSGIDADTTPSPQGITLGVYSTTAENNYVYVQAGYLSGARSYRSNYFIDGASQDYVTPTRDSNICRLRIVRTGTTVYRYYQSNGGSWVQMGSSGTWVNHNVLIRAKYYCGTSTTSSPRGAIISNIDISSGTIATGAKTVSGTVAENGTGVARTVRVYSRTNGKLLAETTSAADGSFSFTDLVGTGDRYVVALDDDAGTDFNALIYDRITPGAT